MDKKKSVIGKYLLPIPGDIYYAMNVDGVREMILYSIREDRFRLCFDVVIMDGMTSSIEYDVPRELQDESDREYFLLEKRKEAHRFFREMEENAAKNTA